MSCNSLSFARQVIAIVFALVTSSCVYVDEYLIAISEAVSETEKSIESLHVSYISRNTRKKNAPKGAYLYREFQTKADGHFYHTSGHGFDGFDWKMDPFRQTTYVDLHSNTNLYNLERSFFSHELARTATLPGSMKEEPFFLSTGLWPFSQRKAPGSTKNVLMLRTLFSDFSMINLEEIREYDGAKVARVSTKSGSDIFWFDMEKNCTLIKREFIDVKRNATISVFENLDQTEFVDGIWLPRTIVHHEYDFLASKPSDRSRRIFTGVFEVSRASVNSEDELIVPFAPPKGSVYLSATDRKKMPIQVASGAPDYLDSISCWIGEHFVMNAARTSTDPMPVCFGLFTGGIAGMLITRFGRQSPKSK